MMAKQNMLECIKFYLGERLTTNEESNVAEADCREERAKESALLQLILDSKKTYRIYLAKHLNKKWEKQSILIFS